LKLKLQTVAEKTAKNFRGLLYFAAPGMWLRWKVNMSKTSMETRSAITINNGSFTSGTDVTGEIKKLS